MPRPEAGSYPVFYETYISLVPENDLAAALQQSVQELRADLDLIPSGMADYAYAPGKWTIGQLLQHTIDTERIFCYRALSLARGEKQPLPGFDENAYAAAVAPYPRVLSTLKEEFLTLRISTEQLFTGFDPALLAATGVANGNEMTVNSIGYMILGHWRHHSGILKSRYGIG